MPAGSDDSGSLDGCTRMKWSVKDEWGTISLTAGMWQPMHPVVGFTGQVVCPDIGVHPSGRPVARCRRYCPRPCTSPEWHDRHLDS